LTSELLKQLRAGENKAFENIFNLFFPALCSFADTYVHNHNISEDVVQEVFIALWNNRENFNNPLPLKSFLYTSVRNRCLNYLKHQNVANKHIEESEKVMESDVFFFDHLIEEETHRLIYNAIDELPPHCKRILLLSLNGLTNPEIADQLNISINTVKTQKAIAYKQLRIKLKDLVLLIGLISRITL